MPNHFNLREKGKETLTTFNYQDPDLFVPSEAVRHLKSRCSAGHSQPFLVAGGSQTWKVLWFPLITSTLEIPGGVALVFLSSSSQGPFGNFYGDVWTFQEVFFCFFLIRELLCPFSLHMSDFLLPERYDLELQNVSSSFEPLNPRAPKELSHTSLVTRK